MAKATKKAATKKTVAKKAAAKTAPKKGAAKKATAKKAPAKKAAVKTAPKKAASKKVVAQKAATKKVSAKKVAPTKAIKKVPQLSDETMLEKLFTDSLQDIYYAEKAAVKAMPKLSKAATSPQLKEALDMHLEVTIGQVERIEQIFGLLNQKVKGKKCEAIEGLIKEADSMVKETRKGSSTRDVALIMASQKMEHYEIATYGSLATLAAQMGENEIKNLLGETLQEEKEADQQLTTIAESFVNQDAEAEGDDEEGTEDGEADDDIEGDVEEEAKTEE